MNILICGLGSIGMRHFRILKQLGVDNIYAYRTGTATLELTADKAEHPDQVFTTLSDTLDAQIDAALVTNPTSMHIETAQFFAERSIPLFIEKPLSHNLDGLEKLSATVSSNDVPVLVGYNLIFHPAILRLRTLLKNNKIGKIISVKAHWGSYMPDWHPWEDYRKSYASIRKKGGGAVLTLSHELNFLTLFFGKAKKVMAMQAAIPAIEIGCDEGVDILIHHESGVISNSHLNFFQKPYRRSLEIIGTNGTILWNFMTPQIRILNDKTEEVLDLGIDAGVLLDESYKNQMQHFLDVVKGNEESKVSLEKGIEDQRLFMKILADISQ
jgi:predicted dehydrogenase